MPRFQLLLIRLVWLGAGLSIHYAATEALSQQNPTANGPSQRHLPAGFTTKAIRLDGNGPEYKYAVFVPPQYKMNPDHKWPLILFLHGSAECGEDGIRQTTVGLPVYVSMHAAQFPFIVLMPQAHSMWFRGQEALAVWQMLGATMKQYRIDEDRVYLTGLSMGGYGAWEFSMLQPDAFAAVVPVCGSAPKEYLSNIAQLPIWAFHGSLDANVPVAGSRDAIKELRRIGGKPKYTEYAGVGHVCWDQAYAEPELWKWLRAQKRKAPKVVDYRFPGGTAKIWWLAMKSNPTVKTPVHIRTEILDDGQINAETDGIESWGLYSDREPLAPGMDIQVNWNGAVIYRGKFKGSLSFKPGGNGDKSVTATTQPHEESKNP